MKTRCVQQAILIKKLLPNVEGDIGTNIVEVKGVALGLVGYETS
jgi:hypothetical protein